MSLVNNDLGGESDTVTGDTISDFNYASLGSRFVANVIDNIAIGVGLVAPIMLADATGSDEITTIAVLLGIGFGLFYLLILEGVWSGQTLGKKLLGIRVVRKDGSEVGITQSVIRNIIGAIGKAFGLLGLLTGAFAIHQSEQNQRLGDSAASTVVIED